MKHGSLFSGIGGFDLASQWMGWDNVFNCEIEKFPRKILNYYWPNAITYEDIKSTNFKVHRGKIDILTGGFPCQPYSVAGKRKGKDDERHLWPEMLRSIREISPRWVVGENVRGLINWNGGLVFDEVQSDLEAEGYKIQPFILPAASVGAPHRRDRIWFVAYSENNNANRFSKYRSNRESFDKSKRKGIWSQFGDFSEQKSSSDTDSKGLERQIQQSRENGWAIQKKTKPGNCFDGRSNTWFNFPTQSPVCGGDDGLPSELDGITFPKWRNESIKGYGNAVVPQVVYQIFKAIQEYENTRTI
jgi:DNA (cytosine-5)-methyltransferase 1